jgi:hypothetical protein
MIDPNGLLDLQKIRALVHRLIRAGADGPRHA